MFLSCQLQQVHQLSKFLVQYRNHTDFLLHMQNHMLNYILNII